MTHGSLFSGIGGFDLAAEWMGWENKFHCEWNPFGQKVLHHYWPQSEQFTDITKSNFKKYANKIDILTGGFPCQPYSAAGKRLGKADDRHLWPHMLRAIKEIQPRWVVGENVLGLVNWSGGLVFHEVQTGLEAAGYEVFPYVLPAVSVNAPHRRDRVWFVAYAKNNGHSRNTKFRENIEVQERSVYKCEGQGRDEIRSDPERYCKNGNVTHPNRNGQHRSDSQHEINTGEGREHALGDIEQMGGDVADTGNEQFQRGKQYGSPAKTGAVKANGRQFSRSVCSSWEQFPTQSPICSGDDGISARLDGITFSKWRNESIKAAGNAIVPQVVYQIFKTIQQYETS